MKTKFTIVTILFAITVDLCSIFTIINTPIKAPTVKPTNALKTKIPPEANPFPSAEPLNSV